MMKHAFRAAALAALVVPTSAQQIQHLVIEGTPVAGVGDVTTIDGIAINDLGQWMVESDTNFADTDFDGIVLRDGVPYLREGDAVAAPAGASIDSFDSIHLNDAGSIGWNLFLDGTAGTSDDSGFYKDTTLLFQEGDAPAIAGLSAGTPFRGFFESKTDDAGTALLIATVDDPALASTVDQVLLLVSGTDPASLAFTLVAKEGDVLAGQTEAVEDFNTGPHDFAHSENGRVMFFADLTGDTALDGVIYLDGALVAQEGSPSPVAGRDWSSLSSAKMDVSATGHVAYSGTLSGDSASASLIVLDGAKLVQEGDSLPSFAPFVLTSFGSGPVCVDNGGNVLWYGDWDDPDTTRDAGLFRNDVLLLQEGVSQYAGLTIETVRGVSEGYVLSDDGRYAVVEVELTGDLQAALQLDFGSGEVTPMSQCTTPAATLTWTAGVPQLGGSFDLTMDGAQALGALPALALANLPIGGWPTCGVVLPGIGELLIDVLPPNPMLTLVGPPDAGLPTTFTIAVPVHESLIGLDLYAQGIYVDSGPTAEPFRMTGGVVINVRI